MQIKKLFTVWGSMEAKIYIFIVVMTGCGFHSVFGMRQRTTELIKKEEPVKVEKQHTAKTYQEFFKEGLRQYMAKNYEEAIPLFKKVLASPRGCQRAHAEHYLGLIYLYGDLVTHSNSSKDGLYYLQLAAEQTDDLKVQAEACWCLGAYFFAEKQYKTATQWLELAAKQVTNSTIAKNAQKLLSEVNPTSCIIQ
jgi:TPR repeat protein